MSFVASPLALAAALMLSATAAAAQDAPAFDPYSEFSSQDQAVEGAAAPGFEVAPGYDRPDFDTTPNEREVITVFEEPPLSTEPQSLTNPINVFAGQRQRYDNGVFGVFDGR
ncbi:MAG: hypothetical protein AAGM38_04310 [Pseudomonadota bacterium]